MVAGQRFGGDDVPGAKEHQEENALDELYRAVIEVLSKRPHNRVAVPDAQIKTKGNNPICGDVVTVYGKLNEDGIFERVAFEGKACAICTASASLMTDRIHGKSIGEANLIVDHFKAMMRNEVPFEVPSDLLDLEALEGVRKFPVRVKCATLDLTTLKNGILEYLAGRGESSTEERCDIP